MKRGTFFGSPIRSWIVSGHEDIYGWSIQVDCHSRNSASFSFFPPLSAQFIPNRLQDRIQRPGNGRGTTRQTTRFGRARREVKRETDMKEGCQQTGFMESREMV